jgi:hypothetical protein
MAEPRERDLNVSAASPIKRPANTTPMAKAAANTTTRKAPTVAAKKVKMAPMSAANADKVGPRPETTAAPSAPIRAKSPKG